MYLQFTHVTVQRLYILIQTGFRVNSNYCCNVIVNNNIPFTINGALSQRFCCMLAKTTQIFDKEPPLEHEIALRALGGKC